MKTMAVNIVIGAALAAGFKGVTTKAGDLVKSVGVQAMAQQQRLNRIGTFRTLKKQSVTAEKGWNTAQASVGKLAQEMKTVPSPTKAMTKAFAAAKREAASAKRVFKQSQQSLQTLRTTMRGAGQDTKNWANQTKVLTNRLKTLETQQRKITSLRSARQANLQRRGELRGQLFETGAMAAAVFAPVAVAIKFESSMASVKKVMTFDTPGQFKTMRKDILNLSRVMPMAASGIAEITATGARSGLKANELKQFTQDAIKMSVAFDMIPQEAASAMTGFKTIFKLTQKEVVALGDTINVLDNGMDATAAGITNVSNRTGALAKQFGLTAGENAAMAATFLALKVPTQVAATGMKAMYSKLSTAESQSDKFKEGLETIGLSASDMAMAIEDDAMGAIMMFLDAANSSDDKMTLFSDMFGLEYSDDMANITGGIDELKKALALVADKTKNAGAMQREYEEQTRTTTNAIQIMKNKVVASAIAIGSKLLPTVRVVSKVIGGFADGVSFLTNKFPLLTTVVYGAIAAMITMRLVTLAGGYAWTFLKGAWIGAKLQLVSLKTVMLLTNSRMKTMNALTLVSAARFRMLAVGGFIKGFAGSLLMMARTAIPAVIIGMRALTVAMLFNPIGLAVAGIVAGAVIIVKYWKPIKAFFGGLWSEIGPPILAIGRALSSAIKWTPIGIGLRAVGAGFKFLGRAIKAIFGIFKPVETGLEASHNAGIRFGHGIKIVFGGIANFISAVFLAPFRIVHGLWGGLKRVLSWSPIAAIKRGFIPASQFVGRVFHAPVKGVQMLWGRLKKIVSWSPKAAITGAWIGLPTIFKSVLGKVKSLVKLGMKTVAGFLMAPLKTVQKLWDKLTGLGKKSKTVSINVIETISPKTNPPPPGGPRRPPHPPQLSGLRPRKPAPGFLKTSAAVAGFAMVPLASAAAHPVPLIQPAPIVNVAAPVIQTPPALVNVTTPPPTILRGPSPAFPAPIINVAAPVIQTPPALVNVTTPPPTILPGPSPVFPAPVINVAAPNVEPSLPGPGPSSVVNFTTPKPIILRGRIPVMPAPVIKFPRPKKRASAPSAKSPIIEINAPKAAKQAQQKSQSKPAKAAPPNVQHIKHGDIHVHITLTGVIGDARAFAETIEPELTRFLREAQEGRLHD